MDWRDLKKQKNTSTTSTWRINVDLNPRVLGLVLGWFVDGDHNSSHMMRNFCWISDICRTESCTLEFEMGHRGGCMSQSKLNVERLFTLLFFFSVSAIRIIYQQSVRWQSKRSSLHPWWMSLSWWVLFYLWVPLPSGPALGKCCSGAHACE